MTLDDPLADDPVRAFLKQLLSEHGVGAVPLSKELGKNRAYFQQYLQTRRPRPRFLPRDVRIALGRYFGVDPEKFRHPEDRPDQTSGGTGPDRALLHRAFAFAQAVLGDDPEDQWLRVEVAGAALGLFERAQSADVTILIDGEDMVRTLRLLVERIRARYAANR